MALSHAEPFLAGVVSCYSYYPINDLLSSVAPLHQVNTGKAQCRNHTELRLLHFYYLFLGSFSFLTVIFHFIMFLIKLLFFEHFIEQF